MKIELLDLGTYVEYSVRQPDGTVEEGFARIISAQVFLEDNSPEDHPKFKLPVQVATTYYTVIKVDLEGDDIGEDSFRMTPDQVTEA